MIHEPTKTPRRILFSRFRVSSWIRPPTFVDTHWETLVECRIGCLRRFPLGLGAEELTMTLVKIIVITVLIILSILLFGRFFI